MKCPPSALLPISKIMIWDGSLTSAKRIQKQLGLCIMIGEFNILSPHAKILKLFTPGRYNPAGELCPGWLVFRTEGPNFIGTRSPENVPAFLRSLHVIPKELKKFAFPPVKKQKKEC